MDYNFIKESYIDTVKNLRNDNTPLKYYFAGKEQEFILNHNIDSLSQILKFLNSEDNIFILNGFMGSGKTYIADTIVDFIHEDVLIFRNSYQEAINLDDILLSLFKDFSIYHNETKITLPKVDSTIFSEKINAYIKYCNAPMLFIFDSFEINMRNKDTQKDILDFINYLSHFAKIKIIICSRTFRTTDLISNTSCNSYNLKALSLEEMFDYLSLNDIKGSKYECQELYKVTRGHYLLLEFSVLIMQTLKISLTSFSTEYKKSTKNFLEFLVSKILSISSEKYLKLLLVLAVLRHGVSLSFLVNQKFATEDDIEFLLLKHVISEKFGKYYLKDYIKNEFIKAINLETKIKVHKYLLEVYESELPLKPFDRELFLSRLTMRQEIAFHQSKINTLEQEIEKMGRPKLSDVQDFTYLSYSRTSGYEAIRESQSSAAKRNIKQPKERIKRFELSNTDSILLNATKPDDLITKHFENIVNVQSQNTEEKIENKEQNTIIVPNSLEEYVDIAQSYENAFDFSSAITYYNKALTYKDDSMYKYKEPIIYTKLAICYKRIENNDEAINNYEKVYQLYIEDNIEKANESLLSIAQIYSESYKFDKAKEVYKRILYSPKGVSSKMVIRVFLELSDLEDNNMDIETSAKFAQKALSEAEKLSDTELLCECYFKYASLLDDIGNSDVALKYYLRCVQTSNDANKNEYLASAYSNMAEISFDNNNLSAAKMYFELSIAADTKKNNSEGLYYSYLKLAKILEEQNSESTYDCYANAISAAKNIDDINYQISAYIETGAFYSRNGYYKQALKSFMIGRTLSVNNEIEDVKLQIDTKINKIKNKLGEVEFLRLINEIKNKK